MKLPFGDFPVPEGMRQWFRDIKDKHEKTFHGTCGSEEVWHVDFCGGALDEYECIFHHPYIAFGTHRGGNYYLLFDLSDKKPTNPAVYELDHESFDAKKASRIASSFSTFLRSLEVES